MDKMKNKHVIVVVGPGRSGTSVITRALKVLGVDLGDNLMPPKAGVNDKGFWEDQDIYSFNLDLCKELNYDWHKLTPVPFSLLESANLSELKQRAINVLNSKLKATNLFGIKDPQLTRLLPFWRDVFGEMGIKESYVIACRNPMSVARSLSKYTGISLEIAYLLWFEYTLASLTDTKNANRVVVDYDLIMENPTEQLYRTGQLLNLEFEPASESFIEYQSGFLEMGLRHTEFQISDLRLDQAVPPKVIALYEFMLELATDKMEVDGKDAVERIEKFTQIQSDERFLLNCIQNGLHAIEVNQKRVDERDVLIVDLGQTVESVLLDRDSQKAGLSLLQASYDQMTQENSDRIKLLYSTIAERDALIASLGQRVESLLIDLNSKKEKVEQLQTSLDNLSQGRAEQVSQLSGVVAEQGKQVGELETALSAVYNSRSWRLTSPLRWLIRSFSRIGSDIKNNRYVNLQLKSSSNAELTINTEIETNAYAESNHARFRILLVSYYCPTRAHAGGLRILDIYALIRRQCPNVQIDIFTHHRPSIDWSLDDVNALFDNVYLSPTEELTPETLAVMRGSPLQYDVIDLQFHQSAYQIDAFRLIGTKIIFTPMESLAKVAFINLRTNFLTVNKSRLNKIAASFRLAVEEIRFALKADEVICVSGSDARFLRVMTLSRHILGLDTGVSQFEFSEAIAPNFVCTSAKNRRCNILYVAYFGSETNVLALRWYLDNVHPLVKASVPGYVLTVVGRGDLSAFSNDHDKSIEFVGEVAAIAPYIQEARVGIAPALSGSGFRGKVNQYAILGVPSVVSSIAHKGLAYQDSENIFVAEKPEIFAAQCIRLLTDFELNDRMGQAARELCLATYSWQSKWAFVRKIYNLDKEEVMRGQPKVTALVPSYNHGRYIHERIESIMNQTYSNIELIVIDDCSDDDSHEVISKLQARYGFQYLRNEKNSGTPFAAWERICTLGTGDYIWVCESDDVAEPCFLEKAVARLVEEPDAVLFYSNSHIINELSEVIGHTRDYFHDIWKEKRWDAEFVADGREELLQFQLRGQTVPNMSSALIKTQAFKVAFTPFLKRLRLTGDWLFIGDVMQRGRVIFSPDTLSRFRKHEVTSRARVKSARSQAEFILTKYRMFRQTGQPVGQFATLMASDVIRFLYEPASWWEVIKALMQVSWIDSIKFTGLLFISTCKNTNIIHKFRERYKHAKGFNKI